MSVKQPPPFPPHTHIYKSTPLTDNIKMDRIPTKINEKYKPFLHCISSFEGTSYKNHFSQMFRTSFNIIWKNIFFINFPFLMDSLKPTHPLNSQNLLSVTKGFCWCSLIPKKLDAHVAIMLINKLAWLSDIFLDTWIELFRTTKSPTFCGRLMHFEDNCCLPPHVMNLFESPTLTTIYL